jgi:hypothetical protein
MTAEPIRALRAIVRKAQIKTASPSRALIVALGNPLAMTIKLRWGTFVKKSAGAIGERRKVEKRQGPGRRPIRVPRIGKQA